MSTKRLILPTKEADVSLKQFIQEDARTLFELIDRNRVHLSKRGDGTTLKYLDHAAVERSITNPSNPTRIRFGIWEKNTLVGTINLTPHDDVRIEIGYWIGSQFKSKGFTTLAVRTLIEYVTESTQYSEVVALVRRNNKASRRVVEKVGFNSQGCHPKDNDYLYFIRRVK